MVKKKFLIGAGIGSLYFIFFIAMQLICSFAYSIIYMLRFSTTAAMDSNDITSMAIGALIFSSIFTVLSIILFHFFRRKKPLEVLEANRIHPLTAVLAVIAAVSAIPVLNIILSIIPFPENWISQYENNFDPIMNMSIYVQIAVIGILGPICEEVVFRGMVMNEMRRRSNGISAIIFSSVLFGIVHMMPFQICFAIIMGLLLALVFHLTKSIWVPVIMHIVNNSISCFSEYIPEIPDKFAVLVFIISAVVLFGSVMGMRFLQKKSAYKLR